MREVDKIVSRSRQIIGPQHLRCWLTFIGTGAIGSHAAELAARCGAEKIRLVDPDNVEVENCGTQLYGVSDVSQPKVAALAQRLKKDLPHLQCQTRPMRLEDYTGSLGDILIVGVDTLETRQAVWRRVENNPEVVLFIEAGTSADAFSVRTVRPCHPDDCELYSTQLAQREEAPERACAAAHIQPAVATAILQQIALWAKGEQYFRYLQIMPATWSVIRNDSTGC